MEMERITIPQTGDSYIRMHHPSGLEILVWEMEGFRTTEALFGTKYGSINTRFRTLQDQDVCVVPEGIAHFLEHKLFENEDCDAFALYAKTGANANAYTSFDKTCYLFSCADHYQESLEILLSFVQAPYFTAESVAKEQGIIGQEIRMCNDNPGWRVFFNILGALYHNHPVKIDIAGTEESIAQINKDLLYRCYNTFYNLHNMVLVLAGNVKADEVAAIADRLLKPCENQALETFFPEEPDSIVQAEVTEHLPVGLPLFQIGFKAKPEVGAARLRAEYAAYIAVNILCDPSSALYQSMMQEGLINSTFSTEIFCGDGYFSILIGGESEQPREVQRRVLMEIKRMQTEGLDRQMFADMKRATYGALVRETNNAEAVASNMLNSYLDGVQPFEALQVLAELSYEDVQQCLCERFAADKTALSIVESGKEGE